MSYRITSKTPASRWAEAFPLGNGQAGAMLYCRPDVELVELSEASCISGGPGGAAPEGAAAAFRLARERIVSGDWEGGEEALSRFIGERGNYGTNLPLARLRITFSKGAGKIELYERSLCLDEALASWHCDASGERREAKAFYSRPRGLLVFSFKRAGSGPVVESLGVEDELFPLEVGREGDDLAFSGRAVENKHSDGRSGVRVAGRARVLRRPEGELLLVAVATDYAPPGTRGPAADPARACRERIEAAADLSFDELFSEHLSDYAPLFSRVGIELGPGLDAGHAALLFQYGRYLLICSSRPGAALPAHLQGAWNDSVACRIGWTCDLHLDVNTQMNYWPAEVANISECCEPLFAWIEDSLVPAGTEAARGFYGLPGWCAELVSNGWGYAAPYWHLNLAPCPTGGAWLASQLWEHYLFTLDRDFLERRAYPALREASRFFLGYLFGLPGDESLHSGPSISPENVFVVAGKTRRASIDPTYEIAVIRNTLCAFVGAATALREDPTSGDALCEADEALVRSAQAALPSLRPYESGPDGELKEWAHDYASPDPQHRHLSHLLGLYPFDQIDLDSTPRLARAAAASIRLRTEPEEGWEDTGWARSMLALYSARLRDGKQVERHLASLSGYLANPNLMIRHPPTRGAPSFADVYELDGNTGFTAAVAECLVQSQGGVLRLLPALPPSWTEGRVSGLRARGGLTIDMEWKENRLTHSRILPSRDGTIVVEREGRRERLEVKAGIEIALAGPFVL